MRKPSALKHAQHGKRSINPVRIPKGGIESVKRAGQLSFGFGGNVKQYGSPKRGSKRGKLL